MNKRAVALLSAFHFVLGVGYVAGFFSANAMLVSRFGTSPLFYVYLGQGILTFFFSAVFYLLADRFSRRSFLFGWFTLLGTLVLGCWFLLRSAPDQMWIYVGVRSFFDAVAITSSLGFWLIASDCFSHQEAKRRFSTLIAAFILGDVAGGFLIQQTALALHSLNFILLWAAILILSPFLFARGILRKNPQAPVAAPSPPDLPSTGLFSAVSSLSLLLFVFWLCYSFFSDSTDYLFNTMAAERIRNEDALTSYFGKVALLAYSFILVYHLLFSGRVIKRFGIDFTAAAIPILIAAVWCLAYLHPTLLTLALAQGVIYFFIDYLAIARLHIPLTVFPKELRGRVRAFTEGFGRAAGFVLLFFIARIFSFSPEFQQLGRIILAGAFLFLAYPILFRSIYFRHLLGCLRSKDFQLFRNAVQGLGEPNKRRAHSVLLGLLKGAEPSKFKRTIARALGRMRSPDAFQEIVDLFPASDRKLQLAIVQALAEYDSPQAILALLKLLKFNPKLPIKTRLEATTLLTKRIRNKMLPFLLEALLSEDPRIMANAIEAMGLLSNRRMIPVLLPLLQHSNCRVRASAAIALHPFRFSRENVRSQAARVIQDLYRHPKQEARRSARYAIKKLSLDSSGEDFLGLPGSGTPPPSVNLFKPRFRVLREKLGFT